MKKEMSFVLTVFNLSALLSTKKDLMQNEVITKKQLNTMYMLQRSRVDNVFMP